MGHIDALGVYRHDGADFGAPAPGMLNAGADQLGVLAGDTGWLSDGIVYAAGVTRAVAVAGWQALSYRRTGRQVWLNGVVTTAGAVAAPTTLLTLPAGYRPGTIFLGQGDVLLDVLASGAVRARQAIAAGTTFGVDLRFVL